MAEDSQKATRFGLRYEDMSTEELEYYREFWQEPAPDPQFLVTESSSAQARVRMLTGLSFTLLLVGLLASSPALVTGILWWGLPGLVLTALALVLLVLVRRRYFAWLRPEGEAPLPRAKSPWFWLAHSLFLAGLLAAVWGSVGVPAVYAELDENLRRNYVMLWQESGMFLILLSALAYGLVALSAYSTEDTDESIIRPTDFEEKLEERDRARGRRPDSFYDSDWLSGK